MKSIVSPLKENIFYIIPDANGPSVFVLFGIFIWSRIFNNET